MKVNLRKHRSAVWRSAVPNLGVTCPTFLPVRSTAFLQLAVFQHLSPPRMYYFGSLPCAAKQIPDRLPMFHRESTRYSVLMREEHSSPFPIVPYPHVFIETL